MALHNATSAVAGGSWAADTRWPLLGCLQGHGSMGATARAGCSCPKEFAKRVAANRHPGVGVLSASLVQRQLGRAGSIDSGTRRSAVHVLRSCGGPSVSLQPWGASCGRAAARLPRSDLAEQPPRKRPGRPPVARHHPLCEPDRIETRGHQRGVHHEQATSRGRGGAASGA